MSTSHRAKRPYAGSQPTITSFFPQASGSPIESPQQIEISAGAPSFPQSPDRIRRAQLPHHVQVNLLSVGMRVRKSVPEGYKIGGPHSALGLFSDNKTPLSPISETATRKPARSRARELTPFCGILKVGGLGVQQRGIHSPPEDSFGDDMDEDEELAEEDLPYLSSQGSTISKLSVGSTRSTGNKRRFDGDSDEMEVEALAVEAGGRIIAVPRKKRLDCHVSGIGLARRDNRRLTNSGGSDDFEDAEFLDYELEGEVEMGGI